MNKKYIGYIYSLLSVRCKLLTKRILKLKLCKTVSKHAANSDAETNL